MPVVRNVVLVHGLYADGSSWSEVVGPLQAAGLRVTAVQNPLTSFEDDVATSWYAVSKQDRTIDPELERFMAKRMNATTIEIDTGHLSLISHPQVVANLILAASSGK